MYTKFTVRNFRGFKDLKVEGFERINLIAGVNNIGKTALLEALFLHCGAYNPELALRVNAFRGMESMTVELSKWSENPWDSLFNQYNTHESIELIGEHTVTGSRALRLRTVEKPDELENLEKFIKLREAAPELSSLSEPAKILKLEFNGNEYYMILGPGSPLVKPFPQAPPFPVFFLASRVKIPPKADADLYGKLATNKKEKILLEVLKLIEPRLEGLSVNIAMGEPMLHGDVGEERLLPLPVMGEGMVRLASSILRIANAPNGVVLVDEIENGIHHSNMPKLWSAIGKVAREFNTQVFATTHSLECIKAAHTAFKECEIYDFRVHRLQSTKEGIQAVTYDQEDLETAFEIGIEVR